MPWLNVLNNDWLDSVLVSSYGILTVENHNVQGGLGDFIANYLAHRKSDLIFKQIALKDVPPSGTNQEVLEAIGMNSKFIIKVVIEMISNYEE